MVDLTTLVTEQRNQNSMNIDDLPTLDILKVMNDEDRTVAECVRMVLPEISAAIEAICQAMKRGGRLFYVGAGTSGRLGILDAVECPPTFSTSPDLVQGIIAGGNNAFMRAIEGAEDNETLGAHELEQRGITEHDVVIGIAASGRTPYVIGALKFAQKIGATTVSLSSNPNSLISAHAHIVIDVITGPEILTGSTRLKAATAHKQILNMITTTAMIKIGKVYENLMVDVKVSNDKLKKRAINIISTITSISNTEAEEALKKADYKVKPAIVMIESGVSYQEAEQLIEQAGGFIRKAINLVKQ
ncbi:N-acetylmuramic acid 6-phosphate etherase [Paucisalibacillus globulus]|uniref:N-acetylmuramic acid 6-phosphate etherase n=1 Tax=Paucisalibacillus globulus TaxID=351095 RepID=UPI0004073C36|nr:N-acetylmuramic acid 6-phosphate etherase [Paucisalibacillus globulus]